MLQRSRFQENTYTGFGNSGCRTSGMQLMKLLIEKSFSPFLLVIPWIGCRDLTSVVGECYHLNFTQSRPLFCLWMTFDSIWITTINWLRRSLVSRLSQVRTNWIPLTRKDTPVLYMELITVVDEQTIWGRKTTQSQLVVAKERSLWPLSLKCLAIGGYLCPLLPLVEFVVDYQSNL